MKLMVGVRGEDGARYGRYGQLWSWCGGVKIIFVKFVVYGQELSRMCGGCTSVAFHCWIAVWHCPDVL